MNGSAGVRRGPSETVCPCEVRPIARRKPQAEVLYDVVVAGDTPGGLTAAIVLARAGRRVAVVAWPGPPAECPLIDWVPADVLAPAAAVKSAVNATAGPVSAVRFHSMDADKSAEYRSKRILAYAFHTDDFKGALKKLALQAGVALVDGSQPPSLQLGERDVTVSTGGGIRAKMLLIAGGVPADAVDRLALPVRYVPRGALAVAALDVKWTAAKLRGCVGTAMHVVHVSGHGELAMFLAVGPTLHIRLICPRGAGAGPAEALPGLVGALKRAGLLPEGLPMATARAAAWNPPAGVALELESHVAKRTLLIATAGGFADLVTGQTVAPSVRSALLAAETVNAALDASDPQAVLNTYQTEWRKALADALRPPNTTIGLLLPLLFVNKKMVSRFARAMLYGHEI